MNVDGVFARHGCLLCLVRNLSIDYKLTSTYKRLTDSLSGNATRAVIIVN